MPSKPTCTTTKGNGWSQYSSTVRPPLLAKASSPRLSISPNCPATAPAAPSTSSSTISSATPPKPTRPALYPLPDRHSQGDSGTGLSRQCRRSEAVVQAARVAMEFRHRFKVDVFIDLWCYRRHGHNEADDPTLTQPLMYKKIAEHPTILHLYSFQLIAQNKNLPRGSRRYSRADPHPARRSPANRPPPTSPAPKFRLSGASGRA